MTATAMVPGNDRKGRTTFVGDEVGVTGAIAAIIEGAPIPVVFDMPTETRITGTKKKPTTRHVLSGERMRKIFVQLQAESGYGEIYACVETPQMRSAIWPAEPKINGQPHNCSVCHHSHYEVNQGMASQGSFMRAGGIVVGVLIGLGIGYEEVPANVWTAEVFHGRAEKLDHRKVAASLFPAAASIFARVKDDGRADAVLLADYIRRRRGSPF
jgi:hypothetical protein